MLFALTLPGLAVLLVTVALVEHVASRMRRRSPLHSRHRPMVSASLDVFSAALLPGKTVELEQRRVQQMLRDEEGDGAPPRSHVDLRRGIARLRLDGEHERQSGQVTGRVRAPSP